MHIEMARQKKLMNCNPMVGATPVQWRKRRSVDGDAYYENVKEEPEDVGELSTDED